MYKNFGKGFLTNDNLLYKIIMYVYLSVIASLLIDELVIDAYSDNVNNFNVLSLAYSRMLSIIEDTQNNL